MSSETDSDILFLGICDRANYDANKGKWDILGLGHIVFAYIFPTNLKGKFIGINVAEESIQKEHEIKIVTDSGESLTTVKISVVEIENPNAENKFIQGDGQAIQLAIAGRTILFLSLDNLDALFHEPGIYHLKLVTAGGDKNIGSFRFALANPPPLTSERKAAIKSDPGSAQAVRVELGCKNCPTKYRIYAALEKTEYPELKGCIWYEDIPDQFICECEKTKIDLRYIRKNLHGFLGHRTSNNNILNFVPLYEITALRKIRSNFAELLKQEPKEESLQIYIKENPILLHQFPAEKIISKPPIFSRYVADFAILTAQRELIFIEIEKTTTKLMKKNGHRAADLVHAFDQVRDWLHVVDEHRSAVLDDLDINKQFVSKISGVVIAGRETSYDARKLRLLKMSGEDRISFLTYDDLLFALDTLINRFEAI